MIDSVHVVRPLSDEAGAAVAQLIVEHPQGDLLREVWQAAVRFCEDSRSRALATADGHLLSFAHGLARCGFATESESILARTLFRNQAPFTLASLTGAGLAAMASGVLRVTRSTILASGLCVVLDARPLAADSALQHDWAVELLLRRLFEEAASLLRADGTPGAVWLVGWGTPVSPPIRSQRRVAARELFGTVFGSETPHRFLWRD